jgi:hypothetical protein
MHFKVILLRIGSDSSPLITGLTTMEGCPRSPETGFESDCESAGEGMMPTKI